MRERAPRHDAPAMYNLDNLGNRITNDEDNKNKNSAEILLNSISQLIFSDLLI